MTTQKILEKEIKIVAYGNHKNIIQSILDFDFYAKKQSPSVIGIITGKASFETFFWGENPILIQTFESPKTAHSKIEPNAFLNFKSGRKVHQTTSELLNEFPEIFLGHIFAEDTPEAHAVDLYHKYSERCLIAGPSGVGILIPNYLKLGAIGGVDSKQFSKNGSLIRGKTAIVSASGGVTNEIASVLAKKNKFTSFAFAVGGDRFPITPIKNVLKIAQEDENTEFIAYYGELGGEDEYEIIEMIKNGELTKPVITYIAGVIDEAFDKPTQFGHAKALARKMDESARAKRNALRDAGCFVAETFEEFEKLVEEKIPSMETDHAVGIGHNVGTGLDLSLREFTKRENLIFNTSISSESPKGYEFLGQNFDELVQESTLPQMIISSLLGKKIESKLLSDLTEFVFKLFLDHGANVSGGVNTMVSARAGKDYVSSLVSGLLTIGPRFGGATNEAAFNWIYGVKNEYAPMDFVNEYNKKGKLILGIGHKKYRLGFEDPRIKLLESNFLNQIENPKFYDFAKLIENLTVRKKGNLILNVDGAVAAMFLDVLSQELDYDFEALHDLVKVEFFNALFVLSRSIGFSAHYFDQKRLGEGLFRLPDGMLGRV